MTDYSVGVEIGGDASSLVGAMNQATSALSNFAMTAAAVGTGMALVGILNQLASSFMGVVDYAISAASEFEDFSATANFALSNTAEQFAQTAAAAGGMGKNTASAALEAADALIRYNEKVKEIQDNITETMAGQNVIDAETKFADQLTSLQENYAEKIQSISDQIAGIYDDLASKHEDAEQRAADTIADMQASHDNSVADKQEKLADTLAKTKSRVAKAALQKQYDEENKLAEDSFQRQLETKKAELDRSIKEQDDAAKEAADKQVSRLQDQLNKEQALEDTKEEKLKTQEADELSRLDTDNAKKLAKYQQELADEERSYQLSVLKREEAASGGGAAGTGMNLKLDVKNATGEWSTMGETIGEVNSLIGDMEGKTPFTHMELLAAAQRADNLNVSFTKLGPVVADLAAVKGKGFGETMNAVLMATQGRVMMLARQFGINGQMMEGALGRPVKTANDVFDAINKIISASGDTGAAETLGNTYQGAMIKVKNSIEDVVIGFMGINEVTGKVVSGGILDQLTNGLKAIAAWLQDKSHKDAIDNFVKSAISTLEKLGPIIKNAFEWLYDHWGAIETGLKVIGFALAVLATSAVLGTLVGIVSAMLAFGGAIAAAGAVGGILPVIGVAIAAIGGPITLVAIAMVALTILMVTHWTQIKDIIGTVWNFIKKNWEELLLFIGPAGWIVVAITELAKHWTDIWDGIKKAFQDVVDFLKKGVDDIVDKFKNLAKDITEPIGKVKDMLGNLNPFQKKSPSLVEDVIAGVAQIREAYSSLGNINLSTPAMAGASQNYNTTTNNRAVTMNNSFNVQGEGSASNVAEYLGFMLEHKGIL